MWLLNELKVIEEPDPILKYFSSWYTITWDQKEKSKVENPIVCKTNYSMCIKLTKQICLLFFTIIQWEKLYCS